MYLLFALVCEVQDKGLFGFVNLLCQMKLFCRRKGGVYLKYPVPHSYHTWDEIKDLSLECTLVLILRSIKNWLILRLKESTPY